MKEHMKEMIRTEVESGKMYYSSTSLSIRCNSQLYQPYQNLSVDEKKKFTMIFSGNDTDKKVDCLYSLCLQKESIEYCKKLDKEMQIYDPMQPRAPKRRVATNRKDYLESAIVSVAIAGYITYLFITDLFKKE